MIMEFVSFTIDLRPRRWCVVKSMRWCAFPSSRFVTSINTMIEDDASFLIQSSAICAVFRALNYQALSCVYRKTSCPASYGVMKSQTVWNQLGPSEPNTLEIQWSQHIWKGKNNVSSFTKRNNVISLIILQSRGTSVTNEPRLAIFAAPASKGL